MYKFLGISILLLCFVVSCFSQEQEDFLSSLVDEYAESVSEEDYADFAELLAHKINLNEITDDGIQQFFFLTDFEKQSLQYYIIHNTPLLSIYELQYVLGLPLQKAQLLAEFCYVAPSQKNRSIDELIANGKHTIAFSSTMTNISRKDYQEQYGYEGGANKEIIRYRFQSFNSLFWGLTLKKDMGEAFSLKKGFDSQSMYVQLKNQKIFSNIILGDYKATIGQGLILSQGTNLGNSIEQFGEKQSYVLAKHSSTSEYLYSRGLGMTIHLKHIQITPFVSYRNLDGRIKEADFPFTISETGYHRTATEIINKQQIAYTLCGLHGQFSLCHWRIGGAIVEHVFAKDSISTHLRNASVFYSFFKRNLRMYGECAIDKNQKIATIHGIQIALTEKSLFSQSVRVYQKDYQSFMSSAVGRQSSIGNEFGTTTNVRFSLGSHTTLWLSNDLFAFPKETSTLKSPTKGDVMRVKISYRDYYGRSVYYQYSFTKKTEKDETGFVMNSKQSHKLYGSLHIQKGLQLKSCVQCTITESEVGALYYVDVVWKPTSKFTISTRFAQFDASYENRQYSWEDDVMYVFASSQYMYAGTTWYVVAKWKATNRVTFHGKLSQTRYSDKYSIPESYDLYSLDRKLRCNLMLQVAL